MSLYSPSKNFLFTHTPKTAGTSMHRWITANVPDAAYLTYEHPNDAGCHLSCLDAGEIMDYDAWDWAWKFGFVRNPYTWVEAIRRYSLLRPEGANYRYAVGDPVEWADRLHRMCIAKRHTSNGPVLFQRQYVARCNRVYKFEDLGGAVKDIAARLDLDAETFPHVNFNGHPEVEITGEYRDAIATLFEEDFEVLGYEK